MLVLVCADAQVHLWQDRARGCQVADGSFSLGTHKAAVEAWWAAYGD